MSLTRIRRVLSKDYSKSIDWHGEPITITKLSAADGQRLLELSEGMSKDEAGTPTVAADLRAFFAFVAQCCVLEDDGTKAFESDEGKLLLDSMPFDAVVELGSLALDWSGLRVPEAESKKN